LRLALRLFDAAGDARSIRFRRSFESDRNWPPKSVAATGVDARGLVMTNGLGRHLLAFGINSAPHLDVIVAEGEMDFLTAAMLYAPDNEERACFGITQGAWTAAMADRIPRGAKVTILSHDDDAGQGYVAAIAGMLGGRCAVQNRVCR
jgi:hypothetical protein